MFLPPPFYFDAKKMKYCLSGITWMVLDQNLTLKINRHSKQYNTRKIKFSIAYGKTVNGPSQEQGVSKTKAKNTFQPWYKTLTCL